jgi:hypothetical protein
MWARNKEKRKILIKNERKPEVMKTLENESERATTLFPSKLAAFTTATLATLAFALVVGIFSMPAAASAAGSSNVAFAVGGITTVDGHVAFAAQTNPQNGRYAGHVVQDSMGLSRSGPVYCLTVSGNQATVIWTVAQSDNQNEVGTMRSFEVTDNGEPVMGVSPDLFLDRTDQDNNCGDFQGGGVMPVHGNIVVKGP